MAAPSTPYTFNVLQGNGQVALTCSLTPSATSYSFQRSTDGVNFTVIGTPAVPSFLDTTCSIGTLYYYQVAAVNGTGTSGYTAAQATVPCLAGQMSLLQVRLESQRRADQTNTQFLTDAEWNSNIVQSYFELYDLLVATYGPEYFFATTQLQTDGVSAGFNLPTNFYKGLRVDLGLASGNNAWVTLRNFNLVEGNKYVFPSVTSSFTGAFDAQYRFMGNMVELIPTMQAGQYIRVLYIPKLIQPLMDTDILDGVNGWLEYVIIDAAIKAMQKEESDVGVLGTQKQAMLGRIEAMAADRDVGMAETISDTRRYSGPSGDGFGGGCGNGGWGGF